MTTERGPYVLRGALGFMPVLYAIWALTEKAPYPITTTLVVCAVVVLWQSSPASEGPHD